MADASSTSPSKETVTLRLPSGEMVDAIVPAGFSDADLKSYVRMKQPGLFGPPAGVQKPQVDMQTGAAPIATSFATQLSNMPRNLWEGSFFGELGNPRVKAAHEARIKAMQAPGMEGVKNTFQAANPIVTNESGVDIGASAANLLPYALSAKGLRTPDVNVSDALAATKAVGKLAATDAASHIPVAGRLIRRPSVMDYVRAVQTKAPPASDTEIPPSKVSTTPPESVSKPNQLQHAKALQNVPTSQVAPPPAVQDKSTILPRLQQIAQQIQAQGAPPPESGSPLRVAGKDVPASTNLAPALQQSLPQTRVQGKIMQALRREGPNLTVGMDRLMEAPELKGISRQQVLDAARKLSDQGKIWHEQTGGGAHPVSYTMALKKR